ncbi:DNA-binding protein [archaeon]|nr:DNA-binding protein [archaeon]
MDPEINVVSQNAIPLRKVDNIRKLIHLIRGLNVISDTDLALLYDVDTKRLNEQVKRNSQRFPSDFMFQLTREEAKNLKSQNATSRSDWGGRRKLPYVFTEQGIAMLSGILRSTKAIEVNIHIMRAFVSMRRFLQENATLFQRIDRTEHKLLEHDSKFEQIFDLIEERGLKPSKGIFFDGQIFDAYTFVADLVKSATKSIVLVDNYIDESVLVLLNKRKKGVKVVVYTKPNRNFRLDLQKFNSQYAPIEIQEFTKSHDRFLIIDEKKVYHIGASLKDVGKKWFAFSKFDKTALQLLQKLET